MTTTEIKNIATTIFAQSDSNLTDDEMFKSLQDHFGNVDAKEIWDAYKNPNPDAQVAADETLASYDLSNLASLNSDISEIAQKNFSNDGADCQLSKEVNSMKNYVDDILNPSISNADIAVIAAMSKTKRRNLREKINQLDLRKVYPLDRQHKGFVCPICQNGSGSTGDGISARQDTDKYGNDYLYHHCFTCKKFEGKLTDIISHYNNLNHKKDFFQILAIGKKIIKRADTADVQQLPPLDSSKTYSDEEKQKLRRFILDAIKNIEFMPVEDRRGLSLDTLRHFYCGYVPLWRHPKVPNAPETPRLIIPNSDWTYNAILPLRLRDKVKKKYWKENVGTKFIFNFDSVKPNVIIIVVEGEIDAMSIYQVAGGIVIVIALGGVANGNKLIQALNDKFSADTRIDFKFLVLLDNDNAGKSAAKELTADLIKNGYPTVYRFLSTDTEKVDANSILTTQGDDALKQLIDNIIVDAQVEIQNVKEEISGRNAAAISDNNSVDSGDNPSTSQKIFPDCPIDLVIPASFQLDLSGICFVKKDKNGKPIKILISQTPIVVARKFFQTTNHNFSYQLAFRNDKGQWILCKNLFSGRFLVDNYKILDLADEGISIKDAKVLAKYFDGLLHSGGNFSRIPQVKIFRQTGWTKDNNFIYPNNPTIKLDREGIDFEEVLRPYGDKDIWLATFKKIIEEGGAIARVVIGGALSAPLCRAFHTINLQIHLEGRRSAGKTPLIKFAVSIFGDPNKLVKSFSATPKNILEYAMAFSDLPLAMDELETANGKKAEKDIAKLVYDYSDGTANQANKRNGSSRRIENFGGAKISTGEHPLLRVTDKAGAFKRCLPLKSDKLFDEKFASRLHGISENNFGHFGASWIDYVKANIPLIKNSVDSAFDKVSTQGVNLGNIRTKYDVEATHLQMLLMSLIAEQNFEKMLGIFNDADNARFYSDLRHILPTLPTQDQLDDSTRAIDFLRSFVAAHTKNFYGTGIVQNGKLLGSFEVYGNIHNTGGEVDFLPHALKRILEDEGKFPNAEKLIADFYSKGFLETSKGMGYRCKVRNFTSMKAAQINVYRFKGCVLFDYDENYTYDENQEMSDEDIDIPGFD